MRKREGRARVRGPFVWNLSLPVANGAIKIADAALRISRVAVCDTPAEIPASSPTSAVPTSTIIPALLLAELAGGRARRQPGDNKLAAALVIARDWRVRNHPFAPAHQFQHGGIKTIEVFTQIQLPAVVDERRLIGDVHRNWILQVDRAFVVPVHASYARRGVSFIGLRQRQKHFGILFR